MSDGERKCERKKVTNEVGELYRGPKDPRSSLPHRSGEVEVGFCPSRFAGRG